MTNLCYSETKFDTKFHISSLLIQHIIQEVRAYESNNEQHRAKHEYDTSVTQTKR